LAAVVEEVVETFKEVEVEVELVDYKRTLLGYLRVQLSLIVLSPLESH
jgi:hypothetical protein